MDVDALVGMGFPLKKAELAVQHAGVRGIEEAVEWLMEHEDDDDDDDSSGSAGSASDSSGGTPEYTIIVNNNHEVRQSGESSDMSVRPGIDPYRQGYSLLEDELEESIGESVPPWINESATTPQPCSRDSYTAPKERREFEEALQSLIQRIDIQGRESVREQEAELNGETDEVDSADAPSDRKGMQKCQNYRLARRNTGANCHGKPQLLNGKASEQRQVETAGYTTVDRDHTDSASLKSTSTSPEDGWTSDARGGRDQELKRTKATNEEESESDSENVSKHDGSSDYADELGSSLDDAGLEKQAFECQLKIRLTDGTCMHEKFSPREQLAAVRLFIELRRSDDFGEFVLMTNFPKRCFTEDDMNLTLDELGLMPSAVLFVKKANGK